MYDPQNFILASSVFLILFFLSFFFSKVRVPYVLSFMLAGFIGKVLLPWDMEGVLNIFEHLAITLLFFFIGLSYSFERLRGMTKIIVPGLLGFFLNFFPPFILSYLFTKDLLLSFVISAVIYPTSTAITAKLLMDYKRLINPETEYIVGLLIFEDLISIVLLSILVGMSTEGRGDILSFIRGFFAILLLFGLFYSLRGISKKAFSYLDRKVEEELIPFLVLGFLLLFSGVALKLSISDALVAFMLGVLVPEESKTFKTIEKYLLGLKELSVGVFFFMFTFHAKLSFDFNW
ncbi:MAG: cation:proton antiporter, partial [Aquificaceae bacterium]